MITNSPHICLVEDEPDAGQLLADYLGLQGYRVSWYNTGDAALEVIRSGRADWALVLLDVMLPGADGHTLLQALRAQSHTQGIPVLMLTAMDSEQEVVRGLAGGADGYIRKPAGFAEVLAHIQAQLRRHQPPQKYMLLGDIRLHPEALRAMTQDTDLGLTPTEFRLLLMLAQQPRRIFTREELADKLGAQEDKVIGIRTIDAHIKNLRAKMGTQAALIATHRGLGYGINPEML